MTGDDWALWCCTWSSVKAEDASDVVGVEMVRVALGSALEVEREGEQSVKVGCWMAANSISKPRYQH